MPTASLKHMGSVFFCSNQKLKRKHPELAKPDVNWKEYKVPP